MREQRPVQEQQLAQLAKSNQAAMTEKQKLAFQLQVAEVEKRSATEQAAHMQEDGNLRYELPEEGEVLSFHEFALSDIGLDRVRDKVRFFQADACNLPEKFTGYDLVLAANLIDRVYSPRQFLAGIRGRLNQGGILVIASPYSWNEEFTKKKEWLGGYREAGEPVYTLDGLTAQLSPHFRLLGEPREVPFVIRETRRKFQHTVAQLTAWELT